MKEFLTEKLQRLSKMVVDEINQTHTVVDSVMINEII